MVLDSDDRELLSQTLLIWIKSREIDSSHLVLVIACSRDLHAEIVCSCADLDHRDQQLCIR